MKLINKLLDDQEIIDDVLNNLKKGKSVRLVGKTNDYVKAENMKNQSFKADVMYCGLSTVKLFHIYKTVIPQIALKGTFGAWWMGDITIFPLIKKIDKKGKITLTK
jgi:hypothetical protein